MRHRLRQFRLSPSVLAALALACAAAQPATAQQEGQVSRMVRSLTTGLRDFVAGAPPEARAPRELRPCGTLYGPEERQIARGPELLNSYERWIHQSFAVVSQTGPLPVCFELGRTTLTSNQSRFLLHANNYFLGRHRNAGYVLVGYTDPQEADTVLALRRAEEIRLQSAQLRCRYRPARGPARPLLELYRKVEYEPDPAAVSGCRSLPPR